MDSLHLVDPELRPMLELMPVRQFSAETLAQLRAEGLQLPVTEGDGVDIEMLHVPGPAGAPDVGLRIYRPGNGSGPLPVIYHIHGGGYIACTTETFDALNRPTAAELGCAIVSVEYRLAPETPFPGAIEDIYAGLAWVYANAEAQGFDLSRIGVMGESAGGGFAAALALLARDRGEYKLNFQHLIYPMLDDRTCTADPHPYAGEFVWPASNNYFGWASLLGKAPGGDDVSPYAAPARAPDLRGLPPTFMHTGALDLFVDENIDYARRLGRAGVQIEFHIYPGAFHGFENSPDAQISQQAVRTSRAALKRFLSPKAAT